MSPICSINLEWPPSLQRRLNWPTTKKHLSHHQSSKSDKKFWNVRRGKGHRFVNNSYKKNFLILLYRNLQISEFWQFKNILIVLCHQTNLKLIHYPFFLLQIWLYFTSTYVRITRLMFRIGSLKWAGLLLTWFMFLTANGIDRCFFQLSDF